MTCGQCEETNEQVEACVQVRAKLKLLTLDAHKVEAREKARFAANPPKAPLFIKLPNYALCIVLDLIYEGRPIQVCLSVRWILTCSHQLGCLKFRTMCTGRLRYNKPLKQRLVWLATFTDGSGQAHLDIKSLSI